MFQGSYPAITEVMKKLKEKQEFVSFHKARSDCFSTGGIKSAAVGDQFWKELDPTHTNSGPTNSDQGQWLNGVITAYKDFQAREEKHTEDSMAGRDSCTTWSHSFRKESPESWSCSRPSSLYVTTQISMMNVCHEFISTVHQVKKETKVFPRWGDGTDLADFPRDDLTFLFEQMGVEWGKVRKTRGEEGGETEIGM